MGIEKGIPKLNKGFTSKFCIGYPDRQTPDGISTETLSQHQQQHQQFIATVRMQIMKIHTF